MIVVDPIVAVTCFASGALFGWFLRVAIDHAALRIVHARRNGRR